MNFKEIRYILEIARTGSISQAANTLGISQPSLSRFLQRLETEYHVALFIRTPKNLEPTLAGKRYLANAVQMLPLLEQIENISKTSKTAFPQTVTIGITEYSGLEEELEDFCKIHEDFLHMVIVKLTSEESRQQLKNGLLDLVLTDQPFSDPSLLFENIYTNPMVLLVPHQHTNLLVGRSWSTQQIIKKLQQLPDTKLILLGTKHSLTLLQQFTDQLFPQIQNRILLTDPATAVRFLEQNPMFGLTFRTYLSRISYHLFCTIFPISQEGFSGTIRLYYRGEKRNELHFLIEKMQKFIAARNSI